MSDGAGQELSLLRNAGLSQQRAQTADPLTLVRLQVFVEEKKKRQNIVHLATGARAARWKDVCLNPESLGFLGFLQAELLKEVW